ncbi:MAG: hypothetical protein CL914_14665 [Deltaproteobacteria bacterium]|nr:hypothetical protein [Deltaproteobacteria bacterium]
MRPRCFLKGSRERKKRSDGLNWKSLRFLKEKGYLSTSLNSPGKRILRWVHSRDFPETLIKGMRPDHMIQGEIIDSKSTIHLNNHPNKWVMRMSH